MNGPAMALEQVPTNKRRSTVLTMERFFVGMGPFMALLVFGSSERPGTEGANIFLLCSHANGREPADKRYNKLCYKLKEEFAPII